MGHQRHPIPARLLRIGERNHLTIVGDLIPEFNNFGTSEIMGGTSITVPVLLLTRPTALACVHGGLLRSN